MIFRILKILWFAFLWVDLLFATIIMYLLAWLPSSLTSNWYPKLFQKWCWVFIRALGVNLKLIQKNKKKLPENFILIGNHPSAFEDLGMAALFGVRFLAKAEVADWFIVGRISKAARTLYVKRDSKDSRQQAKELLKKVVSKGIPVGVYPEGGCFGRRIHLPFQYGIFKVAMETGVPVIPVFLEYEAQEDFEWADETLMQKIFTLLLSRNKTANYYIYDALDPKDFKDEKEFCEYVQNLYLDLQKKILD